MLMIRSIDQFVIKDLIESTNTVSGNVGVGQAYSREGDPDLSNQTDSTIEESNLDQASETDTGFIDQEQ